MSACNRYTLTRTLQKTLITRGFILVCKICDRPIQVGEGVESKQQKRGAQVKGKRQSTLKMYHSKCYDDSHIDVE